jgi:hypothetical protein
VTCPLRAQEEVSPPPGSGSRVLTPPPPWCRSAGGTSGLRREKAEDLSCRLADARCSRCSRRPERESLAYRTRLSSKDKKLRGYLDLREPLARRNEARKRQVAADATRRVVAGLGRHGDGRVPGGEVTVLRIRREAVEDDTGDHDHVPRRLPRHISLVRGSPDTSVAAVGSRVVACAVRVELDPQPDPTP